MLRALPSISLSAFYVVFRPSAFVRSQVHTYTSGTLGQVRIGGRLSLFYVFNLVLYAVPLTLAVYSATTVPSSPPSTFEAFVGWVYSDIQEAWTFTVALLQNSAFLTAGSVLTFVTFHTGVVVTRNSKGILQTLHTVVYTSGIYLAGIFTLTWYLATAERIRVADDMLLSLQKAFIYYFIDMLNANVGLPGGRPTGFRTVQLTGHGRLILAVLGITFLYFLYSLYLGARINHDTTRIEAIIVLIVVAGSPVVYIVGSILISTTELSALFTPVI